MAAWRGSLVFFLVGAAALVSASSCAQIIGLQPFGSGGAGGATTGVGASHGSGAGEPGGGSNGGATSASTGSAGGKLCAGSCETAPPGWNGPVLVEPGKDCSTGVAIGTLWLPPKDLSCTDCICTATESCKINVETFAASDTMCGTSNGGKLKGAGCKGASITSGANVYVSVETEVGAPCATNGTCTKPEADVVALCGPDKCDRGGVCFEPGDTVCVYSPGSMACPNGYSQYMNEDAFTSYDVNACSCGGPIGALDCFAVSVDFFGGANCTGDTQNVTTDKCSQLSIDASTVKYHPTDPGMCEAPTATVTAGESVTVCCKGMSL